MRHFHRLARAPRGRSSAFTYRRSTPMDLWRHYWPSLPLWRWCVAAESRRDISLTDAPAVRSPHERALK